MPELSYTDRCRRTLDNLHAAVRCLQQTQSSISAAKGFGIINGHDRKLLDRAVSDLTGPIEKIYTVIDTINSQLK